MTPHEVWQRSLREPSCCIRNSRQPRSGDVTSVNCIKGWNRDPPSQLVNKMQSARRWPRSRSQRHRSPITTPITGIAVNSIMSIYKLWKSFRRDQDTWMPMRNASTKSSSSYRNRHWSHRREPEPLAYVVKPFIESRGRDPDDLEPSPSGIELGALLISNVCEYVDGIISHSLYHIL